MKTLASRILPFVLVCLSTSLAFSQPARPKLSPDQPTAVVEKWGWGDNGELVLGIMIYAPTSKTFELGSLALTPHAENNIFTTKESYLTIPGTQETLQALPKYPRKHNFGSIKGVEVLEPGYMVAFTGAYPKPPLPVQKPDGKFEDYQFILHLPCNVPPVTFSIPYESPVAP